MNEFVHFLDRDDTNPSIGARIGFEGKCTCRLIHCHSSTSNFEAVVLYAKFR